MGWSQTDVGEEFWREFRQMRQGCPNDQTADWMADKADLAYAGDGAEWKDVLLDLCG